MMIHQPFGASAYATPVALPPEQSPFTVEELIRMGVDRSDACMIVWPVTEEAFTAYAETRRA